MAQLRTTKQIARRIKLDYFKRPHPFRTGKWVLALLCLLGAGAYVTAYARHGGAVYNPGHVSAAHAMFEQNCTACHDGDGKGGINQRVSDAACSKCHEGSLHHPNQSTFVSLDSTNHPAMAANCASCHVEHRGHAELAAIDNQHCTMCHENLAAHSRATPAVQNVVKAFGLDSHPAFGANSANYIGPVEQRTDPDGKKRLYDRTRLRFNHVKHFTAAKLEVPGVGTISGPDDPNLSQSCALCHTTSAHNAYLNAPGDRKPPLANAKTAPALASPAVDGRYMQPVSYEEHCAACHTLTPAAGAANLPHAQMPVVRTALAAGGAELMGKLGDDATNWFLDSMDKPEYPAAEALKTALEAKNVDLNADAGKQPEVIELYTAYGMANSCAKCHTLDGVTASAMNAPAGEGGDRTAKKPSPTRLLQTLPTVITSTPRRFFAHSSFDHDAHRNLSCMECHGEVKVDHKTASAHYPALKNETEALLQPAIDSCVKCHTPDTPTQRGAGAECMSCHNFHDRSMESPKPGRMTINHMTSGN